MSRKSEKNEPSWLKGADLAHWDLYKHRDYYPAEAMSDDTCVHNGLVGNCGADCKCYLSGKCPIEDEIEEEAED
jgi:hypothetical protein